MLIHPDSRPREPDLVFIAAENLGRLTDKRLNGPADLAIEVLSDESVGRDRDDKFYEYQDGGVREYWIIDPRPGKERVDCYWLTPEGRYQAILPDATGRYHARVLPDFWFHPDWLRQEPLPNPLLVLAEIAPQAMRAALADKLGL
jgi:Uma2 family endonuclease